jgi:hypothetical protein
MYSKNRAIENLEHQLRSKGPQMPDYILKRIRERATERYLNEHDFAANPAISSGRHFHFRCGLTAAAVILTVLLSVFISSQIIKSRTRKNTLETAANFSMQIKNHLSIFAGSPDALVKKEFEQIQNDLRGTFSLAANYIPEQIKAEAAENAAKVTQNNSNP